MNQTISQALLVGIVFLFVSTAAVSLLTKILLSARSVMAWVVVLSSLTLTTAAWIWSTTEIVSIILILNIWLASALLFAVALAICDHRPGIWRQFQRWDFIYVLSVVLAEIVSPAIAGAPLLTTTTPMSPWLLAPLNAVLETASGFAVILPDTVFRLPFIMKLYLPVLIWGGLQIIAHVAPSTNQHHHPYRPTAAFVFICAAAGLAAWWFPDRVVPNLLLGYAKPLLVLAAIIVTTRCLATRFGKDWLVYLWPGTVLLTLALIDADIAATLASVGFIAVLFRILIRYSRFQPRPSLHQL